VLHLQPVAVLLYCEAAHLVAGDGAGPNAEERVAPSRCPCSALSSRKARLGAPSLRKAETGVLEIGDEGMGYGYDVMS